jgi:hypothetical protein
MIDSHLTIEYLQKYAVGDTFIETGTYMGDTVRLAKEYGFKKIHSIEINEALYMKAKKDFENDDSIKIWFGDSIDLIPEIMKEVDGEATFWLDAHASGPLAGGRFGPCPLEMELKSICGTEMIKFKDGQLGKSFERRSVNTHTLFLDDRRLMGTPEWGNVSEAKITEMIKIINKDYKIVYLDGHVSNDVICATVRE